MTTYCIAAKNRQVPLVVLHKAEGTYVLLLFMLMHFDPLAVNRVICTNTSNRDQHLQPW